MAAQQMDPRSNQPSLVISPAVIVGIVILAVFSVTLVGAGVFRYCRKNRSTTPDFAVDNSSGQVFNLNRQRSAGQIARMREVRRINNMYAWERGRHARIEIGEIRPTTMLLGRQGEARNWDEWSIADNSSGRGVSPDLHATTKQFTHSLLL